MATSDCTILDDWHVAALKATESRSVRLERVFVPNRRIGRGVLQNGDLFTDAEKHASKSFRNLQHSLMGVLDIGCIKLGALKKAHGILQERFNKLTTVTDPNLKLSLIRIRSEHSLLDKP